MTDEEEVEDEERTGGIQLDVLKSYLAFGQRAIRRRRVLAMLVLFVGVSLTFTVWRYLPRTFVCTTVMLGEGNKIFGDWQPAPFAAAGNLIQSKENLEAIVRETGLVKKFLQRRPPLLKAKDDVVQSLFGRWDDEVVKAIVVGTLESRIAVMNDGATLTISVAWTDGATAAEVAEAARESFLKTRRATETSAFTEKMAILDRHATKVRQEIEQIAEQIRSMEEKSIETQTNPPAASTASAAPPQPAPRRLALPRSAHEGPDPEQLKRKDELQTMKRRLSDLEGERERQLRDERAKLADLRLKLAPSHPNVLTSQQRIEMLSQVPSDLALLRAEVAGLEQEITQRDSMGRLGMDQGRRSPAVAASEAESLPAAITDLLSKNDVDQALLAQLSGAVTQYGSLRAQIRSERVDIDTADAAFSQRYRVVVPAETPFQPVKPKFLIVVGAGLGLTLLLALLLPVLLELRTGIIIERWQVQHMQIPVLAELRLPPRSGD